MCYVIFLVARHDTPGQAFVYDRTSCTGHTRILLGRGRSTFSLTIRVIIRKKPQNFTYNAQSVLKYKTRGLKRVEMERLGSKYNFHCNKEESTYLPNNTYGLISVYEYLHHAFTTMYNSDLYGLESRAIRCAWIPRGYHSVCMLAMSKPTNLSTSQTSFPRPYLPS